MATRKAPEPSEAPLTTVNPAAANAAGLAAMAAAETEFPVAPVPEDDLVLLPAGFELDGKLITSAQVRELNGGDEEKIFRSLVSRNPFHLRRTILECGAVRVGSEPEKQTPRLLKSLLIGDLDAILFGIYRMTYGDHIEINGWICPECSEPEDIGLDISEDIPVKKLADITDARFTVELKNGATATVHLPTGGDQEVVGDNPDRNMIERNTVLLQCCVEEVVDAAGHQHFVKAFPDYAKKMGIQDRRTIITAIAERQPGPQYNAIKFTHTACGKEVTLGLDLAELFLG